jgi:hypothetical protein
VKVFHVRRPYRNQFPVRRTVEEFNRPPDRKEAITKRRRKPKFESVRPFRGVVGDDGAKKIGSRRFASHKDTEAHRVNGPSGRSRISVPW